MGTDVKIDRVIWVIGTGAEQSRVRSWDRKQEKTVRRQVGL